MVDAMEKCDQLGSIDTPIETCCLNAEWHARPGMRLKKDTRVTHIVTDKTVDIMPLVFENTSANGLPEWAVQARHQLIDADGFSVKWEQHTETNCFTFSAPKSSEEYFCESPYDFLPAELASAIKADQKIGVRLEIIASDKVEAVGGFTEAQAILGCRTIYGGFMSDNHAAVWTSLLLDADGFIRILVVDIKLSEGRLSRLVHRLLDIETYRYLAMSALPVARETMEKLDKLEPELDALVLSMANKSETDQEKLLFQIADIAARAEHIVSVTAYRFAAAKAYEDIVLRRMSEIREGILDGHLRYTVFLDRSFRPAMRTCEAAGKRAEALTHRVSRAANLLNTMVDMALKRQSHSILQSMEKQASTQVRLQQAVEGFSIFAISYYGVGLIAYVVKAVKSAGLSLPTDGIVGIFVPLVIAVSWASVRLVKKRSVKQ